MLKYDYIPVSKNGRVFESLDFDKLVLIRKDQGNRDEKRRATRYAVQISGWTIESPARTHLPSVYLPKGHSRVEVQRHLRA
jgi:hypothetical protein